MDRHVYGVLLALAAWTSLAAGDAEAQIALLPAGAPASGAAPDGPAARDPFARHTWTFQTYGSAAFGDPGKGEMYAGHAGFGYHVADNVSINLDGFGAWIRSGIDDDGVGGGADALVRGHLLRDASARWSIYMDGGAGVQQASTNFAGARHFNFRLLIGFGATLRLAERVRFLGGARYLHISDAGIKGGGGGFDGPMVYAGLTIPF